MSSFFLLMISYLYVAAAWKCMSSQFCLNIDLYCYEMLPDGHEAVG